MKITNLIKSLVVFLRTCFSPKVICLALIITSCFHYSYSLYEYYFVLPDINYKTYSIDLKKTNNCTEYVLIGETIKTTDKEYFESYSFCLINFDYDDSHRFLIISGHTKDYVLKFFVSYDEFCILNESISYVLYDTVNKQFVLQIEKKTSFFENLNVILLFTIIIFLIYFTVYIFCCIIHSILKHLESLL